jgi:hypothetical protein
MQNLKIACLLLGLLFTLQSSAQSYVLEGIKSVSSNGIRAIMNGKEVGGYIVFYKMDKADKKNDNYGFDLLDEKLNKVSSVKVLLPRGVVFLQSVYNGEALGLMFYDPAKKNYIFKAYDKKLALLGSRITEKPNKWEIATLNQMAGADTDEVFYFFGIRPVPGKGFVRSGYGKGNDQFKVTFYDNTFKEKWSYETPKDAKGFETFMISDVNAQYVTGTTLRRDGLMSRKFNYFLTVFNAETGAKLIDVSAEKPKQQLSITSTILQEGSDELLLQGEFYGLDDKPGVNKSKGFYIKSYDLKTGKETKERLYSWEKEVAKLFNAKAKESIEDKYLNYPQILFKTANGHYFMVFEQFKKVADAGGIAMRAIGGGTGVAKVKIGNIWVMEMDADFNALDIKYYEKDASSVGLGAGMDMMGAGLAGYYVRWTGGFDYQFSQQSNDGSSFNIAYINYDREKGEKSKTIVGNIFKPKDAALTFDKVDITAPKNTSFFLYPAQSSSVMLAQFLKKEKKLEFKLVKLNY